MLIGVGVIVLAVAAVVLVLGLNALGAFGGRRLDVVKVQAGVQRILGDPAYGYGSHDVSGVRCNDGRNPSANEGDTFVCSVSVDGEPKHVTVVVEDDSGTYSVDRPR